LQWTKLKQTLNVQPHSCKYNTNIYLGGHSPGGLGHGSPPVGSRAKTPVDGLEVKVPHKLKQFADIVQRFWLQKWLQFKYFPTIQPDSDSWPVCFTMGAKQHFAGA